MVVTRPMPRESGIRDSVPVRTMEIIDEQCAQFIEDFTSYIELATVNQVINQDETNRYIDVIRRIETELFSPEPSPQRLTDLLEEGEELSRELIGIMYQQLGPGPQFRPIPTYTRPAPQEPREIHGIANQFREAIDRLDPQADRDLIKQITNIADQIEQEAQRADREGIIRERTVKALVRTGYRLVNIAKRAE